jgi:hypothetical protein
VSSSLSWFRKGEAPPEAGLPGRAVLRPNLSLAVHDHLAVRTYVEAGVSVEGVEAHSAVEFVVAPFGESPTV